MTSARRQEPRFPELLGTSLAYAAIATLVTILAVVAQKSSEFAGLFDVQMGLLSHLSAFLLLGAVPGALAAFLEHSFAGGRRGRTSFAALLGLAACITAYGVGGGRHLATLALRSSFACLTGAVVFALAFFVFPGLTRVRERSSAAFAGAMLSLFFLLALVNRTVLVRLYPSFHVALSVFEIALLVLAALSAFGRPARLSKFGFALVGLAIVGIVPTARLGSRLDNFRFVMTEQSPALGLGVALCSKLAPSPPVDRSVLTRGLGARRSRSGALDLRGRSILLVTVDALRADHLGAYGYARETTPFLDELAKSGTRFSAAYAATPHTSYSLTSLMTGKYMRPLLLQGAGADSETWPKLLQTYGYRTAGFYPPAVFFIDGDNFAKFRDSRFDFEFAKVEFAEGDLRVDQFAKYFGEQPEGRPIFSWVHLFGPHEPYVEGSVPFGPRDMDRYDSEIRAADDTIRRLVKIARTHDPRTLVVLSADHGEEFGEHGGRYHGTSVYEEQIRVPLIFAGEGVPEGRVVTEPVQTIDLLPTVLGALDVPIPPRLRGRDLGALLSKEAQEAGEGRAVAETEDYSLLAQGNFRLVCERKSGGCKLFDLHEDPNELVDVASRHAKEFAELREISRAMAASHGEYEAEGLRSEGKHYPPAILRGIAGDTDAAPELARLLDDAEPAIRRKAAELLFHIGGTGQLSAERLALSREEDEVTRAWLSLALTRGGALSPRVLDLLAGEDAAFRRFAALALAETGDYRGLAELIAWLDDRKDLRFEDAKLIVRLLGASKKDDATPVLLKSLADVRLRPFVADALATLGDKDAVPKLLQTFASERYATARAPLARALFRLGADEELASPLLRFLGVPDPMEGGLELVRKARLSEKLGGLSESELGRIAKLLPSGVTVKVTVPPLPGKKDSPEVRVVARVRATGKASLLVAPGTTAPTKRDGEPSYRTQPSFERGTALELEIAESSEFHQITAVLPPSFHAKPSHFLSVDLLVSGPAEVDTILFLPVREEIPPPAPKPWKPGEIQEND